MTGESSAPFYPFAAPHALEFGPIYQHLRENEPVSKVRLAYGKGDVWLVARYDDARLVLSDPRFSTAATVGPDTPRSISMAMEPGDIIGMDPPEHTRVRKLVNKAFTVRRVENLRPRTREFVEDCLNEMVEKGAPGDLVASLGIPLPVGVICMLLGVPYEDRELFLSFAEACMATSRFTPEESLAVVDKFEKYMGDLIAKRRVEPTDDLLGTLVRVADEEGQVSERELISLGIGLLVAGFEPTSNQVTNFTYLLLSDRERWAELRDNPAKIPSAVEELLRYTPIGAAAAFVRIALEDVELGGVTIQAGDAVFAHMGCGNRDETVFTDPERLDFDRRPNPHIGFGYGPHYCVGAALARMELQVALEALVTRLPDLDFAVAPEELSWRKGMMLRGLEAFPVVW